ncbi:hypothetical protein M2281_001615 [Mesorhizobium soli]|uniref:AAA family ATPase n=1 Tax=Pseudaminobacter soli (ex Li et al. 2025) TaxID=1295366 RepID=UPI0024769715|nr:AAA family ATPase [Mesorhizobium soli]MDH6231043.1 hypothetical protein [Mesorhizobium soli]
MNIAQTPRAMLGDFLAASPVGRPAPTNDEKQRGADVAIDFLKRLDLDGRHNLVRFGIDPDGKSFVDTGKTFAPGSWDAMRTWLVDSYGRYNCYFSLNEPLPDAPDRKLGKGDIGAIRALCVDVDPADGENLDASRQRIADHFAEALNDVFPPSAVWDTGGGYQAFWKLSSKLPANVDTTREIESRGRALVDMHNSDSVQNVDRILRLPGLPNIPDAKKLARGRATRTARLIHFGKRTFSLDEVRQAVPAYVSDNAGADLSPEIREAMGALDLHAVFEVADFSDLPGNLRDRFSSACEADPKLRAIWEGDATHVKGAKAGSTSEWRFALAQQLASSREIEFHIHDYALLLRAWPEAAPFWDKYEDDDFGLSRQLAREWVKSGARLSPRALVEKWFDPNALVVATEPLFPPDPGGTPATDFFQVVSIDELNARPPAQWLVARHIPKTSLGFLSGAPGAGKTFLAIDLGLSIAYGRSDWHGDAIENTKRGIVVYVAGEGSYGFKARIAAWRARHAATMSTDRFVLIEQAVNMMSKTDIEKMERTLARAVAQPIAAIFIDTVSRVIPGADENHQGEMSQFVGACDRLKNRFGCAIICVHHLNKSADAMRGSTVLMGAADFAFKLTKRPKGTSRELVCEKQKDGPDGWHDVYDFETVFTADGQSSLIPQRLGNSSGDTSLTPKKVAQIFEAMRQAWDDGQPWARSRQSKQRCASLRMQADFGIDREEAENAIQLWERSGFIEEDIVSSKYKVRGFRVKGSPLPEAAEASAAFD